ncbi:MAG: hypothetical protein R3D27_02315 [Hyphomicrobiaceae bacterium]
MGCVAITGALTAASGGSLAQVVKAMAFSFAQIGIWDVVGTALLSVKATLGAAWQVVHAGVHGLVGGALSVAQGGSFLQGFAASAIGAFAGTTAEGLFGKGSDMLAARALFVGAAGCASALATGGKCAMGAVTAAFAHIFNDCMHNTDCLNPEDRNANGGRMTQIFDRSTGKWMWVPVGAAAQFAGNVGPTSTVQQAFAEAFWMANFVVGAGFNVSSPFGGGEASAMFSINPGAGAVGIYGSTGATVGIGVGADRFIGVVFGTPGALLGPTVNSNWTIGPLNVTTMHDLSGNWIGGTIGQSVGSGMKWGASGSFANTHGGSIVCLTCR